MKKILLSLILVLSVIFAGSYVYAAEAAQNSSVTVTVGSIFEASFFDQNISYPTGGPLTWTNVDPQSNLERPDGYTVGQGDVGLVCITNTGDTWYVKLNLTTATLDDKALFYLPQPTNRNLSSDSDGTLAYATPGAGDAWPVIPDTATVVYTAGYNDTINSPFGTLLSFNFAIDPTGLTAGSSHNATITYTMTTVL